MRKHTKIYIDYFGYVADDFMACEICGTRMVDIHHIDCRGMGSSKDKDKIENLMGLCRKCHIIYGDKKDQIDFLRRQHLNFMNDYGKGIS